MSKLIDNDATCGRTTAEQKLQTNTADQFKSRQLNLIRNCRSAVVYPQLSVRSIRSCPHATGVFLLKIVIKL